MQQKTNFLLYLLFGINLIVISGCGKKIIEHISKANYFYINKLSQPVTITAYDYNSSYRAKIIKPNDSLVVNVLGECPVCPFTDSDFSYKADSVTISFSDGKCVTYKVNRNALREGQGVFNIKEYENYSDDLTRKNGFTLRYLIDSSEYKAALQCK